MDADPWCLNEKTSRLLPFVVNPVVVSSSPLFAMHSRFGTGAEYSPCGIFPCGKNPVQNPPPPVFRVHKQVE